MLTGAREKMIGIIYPDSLCTMNNNILGSSGWQSELGLLSSSVWDTFIGGSCEDKSLGKEESIYGLEKSLLNM